MPATPTPHHTPARRGTRLRARLALAFTAACAALVVAGCGLDRAGIGPTPGPGIDAALPDAALPDAALPDGGPGDAGLDGGGPACVPGGCDDGNVCTTDRCDPDRGCVHEPASVACDDGVLCNGADSCAGGSCSVHDGVDPCPGSSTCDPAFDACVGCTGASDCPAPVTGDWGACAFDPATPCATTGVRARTVRSFACSATGTCDASERTETEACARTTDGLSCGAPSTGDWSACSYANATCSTRGSRSRTVTSSVCAAGACTMVATTETESDSAACVRTTDGVTCGDPVVGAWSACGGFTGICGETGTRSRSVRTPACSAGTCGTGTTVTETEACARDTDGTPCDSSSEDVCGMWSPCISATVSACSGSGTRYRVCSGASCVDGACNTSTSRVESEACTIAGGNGSPCVQSVACLACTLPGGGLCTSGASGVEECTANVASCNGSGSCTGSTSPVMFQRPCTCP
jgi:hypothetical protein